MVKSFSFFAATAAMVAVSTSAFALTVEDVLASATTPEEQGLAIAKEADARDLGFGDMEVDVEMVLKNAQGQESTRKMRSKAYELVDTSVGDKTMIVFDYPRDVAGTAFLTYSKILEADDQWLYLPALKRVKRISSKNKSGPFMGSEFAYEDISSPEVGKYSYKYLRTESCKGNEALSCLVIDRFPLYKHSGYTKQTSWIDTAEFRLQAVDFYDRKNELMKSLVNKDYQQYLGKYWRADRFEMVNHLTGKSTILYWKNYRFKTGQKESDFTKNNLKRVR